MKNLKMGALALAVALTFGAGAMAAEMSEQQYQFHKNNIETEYKAGQAGCDSLAGNANDICIAQAEGWMVVAKAELEASYKPSIKTRYEALLAKANADYAVAVEQCDDKAGNSKDVCVQQAKALKVRQSADAEAQMKAAKANAAASGKARDAQEAAEKKSSQAYQDSGEEMGDADYQVGKEKCDELAGSAKDLCLSNARVGFDN